MKHREDYLIGKFDEEQRKPDPELIKSNLIDKLIEAINKMRPVSEEVKISDVARKRKMTEPELVRATLGINREGEKGIVLEFPSEEKIQKLMVFPDLVRSEKTAENMVQNFIFRVSGPETSIFDRLSKTDEKVARLTVFFSQPDVETISKKYESLEKLSEFDRKRLLALKKLFFEQLAMQLKIFVSPKNRDNLLKKISEDDLRELTRIRNAVSKIKND
jgi:hypothetical protein